MKQENKRLKLFAEFIKYHNHEFSKVWNNKFLFCSDMNCSNCRVKQICSVQKRQLTNEDIDEIKKLYPELFI